MKKIVLTIAALIGFASLNAAFAAGEMMHHGNHQHEMNMTDTRTSLGLSAQMKQHQLSNMRGHLEAIQSIVGLIAENKLEEASGIAHTRLGLTPEMQAMCSMMGNENYKKMGFAFHKSGDDLGAVLKTGDVNASLRALNKTMQYCVGCHATFRQ
ncbi:MAG: cytochrome C [Sideroxyarcus sp.]|nr:cytochrome C [Sideroxyarcus sp.]